jgi:hypothetical protein
MDKYKNIGVRQPILCFFLLFLIPGIAFAQIPELVLDSTDIRVENVLYNGVAGYNLFIRKKPSMDSVILTEPSGAHALRATEWNPINGNERRDISGVTLTGTYSQYSIVSSTPEQDDLFGSVFQLFIPATVVYGNPSSPTGTVYFNINTENQINIRTFDHKYADPNRGRFQNNHFEIGVLLRQYILPIPPTSALPPRYFNAIETIRRELEVIILDKAVLDSMDNPELENFLREVFWEKGMKHE